MRHSAFPEATGEDIIDRHVAGDGVMWARLADAAIEMASSEGFRERAGRPELDRKRTNTAP